MSRSYPALYGRKLSPVTLVTKPISHRPPNERVLLYQLNKNFLVQMFEHKDMIPREIAISTLALTLTMMVDLATSADARERQREAARVLSQRCSPGHSLMK